jgi:hypothetical protein
MNETSARYVNAMIRKPNARRNEDLARALSAARDTGSGSTQNLSRIIEAVREKPSTDGATVAMLNKLMRAKTSGNSDALRRAMKEIEDLKRATPVTNRVNDKQKKIAELEKYVVNKGGKLNTQRRVAFMNDAQKSIKAYKNGTNMYNTAKTRITAAYETAYKANLNNMGPKKAIDALQETVNTIGNSKIKTSAREKLNVFIQSSASDRDARNTVIKLKKLDEELGKRKVNRVYLNKERDEALKNINSYNIKNGLAKINRRVQEDMKKRGVEFNTMIANDMYKNVPSNVKTTLRNKYVSGKLNSNDVKRGLNNALETSAGVFKGLENKIANLETELEKSKLTANQRNALEAERNNLKQKLNQNAKNMNNMKTNINTKARNIEKLKNELTESTSPNVRNKLEANLLKKNQQVTRAQLNIKRAKAEIAELTKKLQNGSISNTEKDELAKARGNALAATEELQKLQEEKKSFNAEIAKAKENVEAARAAQSAANRNRNVKVAQAKKSAKASITKAQNNASLKIQEATNKVQNLQNKLTKRTNLTPNQVQNLRKQINNAKANAVRVKQNANTSVAAAQAAAQESMNALRIQANKEVANARSQANAATKAASKAETAAVTAQNQLTQAQTNLAQQRANVKRIQQELNEKTNMSEKQRAKLEQQLLIERRQVANAQKLAQNAKSNANAAVAESRRLVAEAGKAANKASARAAEAEARIKSLEENRNRWQANANKKTNNLKLATQRLAVKNANLIKKADEIRRFKLKIAILQNRSNTLVKTREERNKLQKQLEDTQKILGNTQNNLGQLALTEQRTRGQRNTLSRKLANVRGQRQNLRSRNSVSRKVIAGLTQQRQDAQRGINTLRATTRNLERRRLATDRATNKTFNASAAFNRQMKGVAPRQSWQSLKPKATMVGAVQADVLGKRLREKLLKNIDTTNISGKFVINGGPLPGSERRALKKEVQNPMTRLNRLRAIEKMILNRKTNRNSTILQRRRMNKQGTNVKPVNPNQNIGRSKLQGFAASGLNQKTISDVIRRL